MTRSFLLLAVFLLAGLCVGSIRAAGADASLLSTAQAIAAKSHQQLTSIQSDGTYAFAWQTDGNQTYATILHNVGGTWQAQGVVGGMITADALARKGVPAAEAARMAARTGFRSTPIARGAHTGTRQVRPIPTLAPATASAMDRCRTVVGPYARITRAVAAGIYVGCIANDPRLGMLETFIKRSKILGRYPILLNVPMLIHLGVPAADAQTLVDGLAQH